MPGRPFGIKPCGLGSRDTLRLEAGMPLYGNELDRRTNPYEANMGRVVKLEKGAFHGRERCNGSTTLDRSGSWWGW